MLLSPNLSNLIILVSSPLYFPGKMDQDLFRPPPFFLNKHSLVTAIFVERKKNTKDVNNHNYVLPKVILEIQSKF